MAERAEHKDRLSISLKHVEMMEDRSTHSLKKCFITLLLLPLLLILLITIIITIVIIIIIAT